MQIYENTYSKSIPFYGDFITIRNIRYTHLPRIYYHYVVVLCAGPVVKMRLEAGKMCLSFSRLIPEI